MTNGTLTPSPTANLHPFDPEHLIVNGLGGAFLHPTHVFAPARFASVPDPHADELFEQSLSPRGRSPKGGSPRGASPPGRSPSGGMSRRGSFVGGQATPSQGPVPSHAHHARESCTDWRSDVAVSRCPAALCEEPREVVNCAGELPSFKIEAENGAVAGGGGEFSCAAVYPSPKQSMQLGRQNLHLFRFKNTRFDIIGGAFYFLMVVRTCLVLISIYIAAGGQLSIFQTCISRAVSPALLYMRDLASYTSW